MKQVFLITSILLVFLSESCSSKKKQISEGQLTYAIDYPEIKDNIFLYHVLPKELYSSFKNDKMELKIKKANIENTIIIDNVNKNIAAYFSYDSIYYCKLNPKEIEAVKNKHPKYKIELTKVTDTICGFEAKKAFIINPDFPLEKNEVWYTNQLKIKNPNWFNGFEEIPGVLLKYSIIQYGIKMSFNVVKFEDQKIQDSVLSLKRGGKVIPHAKYDLIINNLFNSFK